MREKGYSRGDFMKFAGTHEIGSGDGVESLILLRRLPEIYLFVMSIENIQPLSITLSPEIEKSLIELKSKAVELAKSLFAPGRKLSLICRFVQLCTILFWDDLKF